MKFLLAKKLTMTRLPDPSEGFVAVTVLQVIPNSVSQIKTNKTDGYNAVQISVDKNKKKKSKKEFRVDNPEEYKIGDIIDIKQFAPGDIVKVQGISKGKGFQGVVKRWGFRGASATHGTKHALREPGSIGAQGPQRVIKGHKMAGRMGGDTVTIKNLTILDIDVDNNLIFLKGAVPGVKGSLVKIESK